MTTETKKEIFCLLTLVLSATTSVLVLWTLCHFFGNTEVDEIAGMFPGFLIVTAVASVPWAYGVNAVFTYFGIFPKEDLTNGK